MLFNLDKCAVMHFGFNNIGESMELGSFRFRGMMVEGIAPSCSREGTGWMLSGSSLRIGCARSGTGWMMM